MTSPCLMCRKRRTGPSSLVALWKLPPKNTLGGLQKFQVLVRLTTQDSPGATKLWPLLIQTIPQSIVLYFAT